MQSTVRSLVASLLLISGDSVTADDRRHSEPRCLTVPDALPADQLDNSLLRLSRLCAVQLLYQAQWTQNLQSPAVPAGLSLMDTLTHLLANSELSAERPATDIIRLTPRPKTAQLQPLAVYAHAEARKPLLAVPSLAHSKTPLQTLHADALQTQGVVHANQLSSRFSGMSRNDGESRRDESYVRGFNIRRETYVDGLRDDNLYQRDLYNLDAVALVKGGDVVLYGRGAVSGIVHSITKKPHAEPIHEQQLSAGSRDHFRWVLDYGSPLSEESQWRINMLAEQSNSFRTPGSHERYGVTASYSHTTDTLNQWWQLELLQNTFLIDRGVLADPQTGVIISPSDTIFYGDESDVATLDMARLRWQQNREGRNNWQLRSGLSFSYTDLNAQNTKPTRLLNEQTPEHTTEYSVVRRLIDFPQVQQNLWWRQSLLWQPDKAHSMEVGFELADQKRDLLVDHQQQDQISLTGQPLGQAEILPAKIEIDSTNRLNSAGLLAATQWSLTPHWRLQSGARVEWLWSEQHNRLTHEILESREQQWQGMLGISYQPMTNTEMWFSFARSYRPAASNLFQNTAIRFSQRAERYYQLELGGLISGWGEVPDNDNQLSARLFWIHQRDRLLGSGDNQWLPGTPIPDGRSYGVELEFKHRLSPAATMTGHYSWLNAYGERLFGDTFQRENSPRHSGLLRADYRWSSTLNSALELYASGARYASTNNHVVLPGYGIVNLSIQWQYATSFALSQWQLQLNNVFNRHYYASANSALRIEPGAPRSLMLTYRQSF